MSRLIQAPEHIIDHAETARLFDAWLMEQPVNVQDTVYYHLHNLKLAKWTEDGAKVLLTAIYLFVGETI